MNNNIFANNVNSSFNLDTSNNSVVQNNTIINSDINICRSKSTCTNNLIYEKKTNITHSETSKMVIVIVWAFPDFYIYYCIQILVFLATCLVLYKYYGKTPNKFRQYRPRKKRAGWTTYATLRLPLLKALCVVE
jgi:hypothetical protein